MSNCASEEHQTQKQNTETYLMSCSSNRPKDGVTAQKEAKTKEETSSDSEDKMAAINKNLTFGKRKPELLLDGREVLEKRKKGRPRKDKMAASMAQPFTQVEGHVDDLKPENLLFKLFGCS